MTPLLETALRGAAIGFVIMMPVGPMATLCILRTLAGGRTAGILTGLGVACADFIYSTVAACGVPQAAAIAALRMPLTVASGLLLALVGVAALRRSAATPSRPPAIGSPAASFGSAFLLTLGVPASTFVYAAAYATFGALRRPIDPMQVVVLTSSTLVGSAGWFVVLCTLARAGRRRLDERALARLNRAIAAFLVACGLGGAAYALVTH